MSINIPVKGITGFIARFSVRENAFQSTVRDHLLLRPMAPG
jgi:hypothetical protein